MRTTILALTGTAVLLAGGCKRPPVGEELPTPTPTPEATVTPSPTPTPSTPTPSPTPTPIPTIPRQTLEVSRLFNGITVRSELVTEESPETASQDRLDNDSFTLDLTLRVRIPEASRTLEQLDRNDPTVSTLLPGLPSLLETAKISPTFEHLYSLKVDHLRSRMARLEQLLTRHNFYDCETILKMADAQSGRRVLLIQGDMDVNTDGSDGDRNFEVDGSSQFFQPQTSYRWRKLTDRPNPFLARFEKRLAEYKKEFAVPGLSAERNRQLRSGIDHAERTIVELKRFSFLISGNDPYIVLPGFMFRTDESPYRPKMGDYAVVLYEGKAYPAIVGDAGPSFKMGEASMRLCLALDERASSIRRPVSSLKVTYLVFPQSAEEAAGQPNLSEWHRRCSELLNEIGGLQGELVQFENLIKPWPTPTPTPTPTPEASPSSDDTPLPESTSLPSPTPAGDPSIVIPVPSPETSPAAEDSPAATPSLVIPVPSPSPTPEARPETTAP